MPKVPDWVQDYAERKVFVCWGYRKTESGKLTKPPLMPSGARAASNDPATWVDLETAVAAVAKDPPETMDGLPLHGIGLVLTEIDDLLAFDLDHAFDEASGRMPDWASEVVRRLMTYVEVTPSRQGLRAIGTVPAGWHGPIHRDVTMDANGGHMEIFHHTARYITLSGDLLYGAPEELADVSQPAAALLAEHLPQEVGRAGQTLAAPRQDLDFPPPTPGDLRETLGRISPEVDRKTWVRVATSLKWEGGEAAQQMFLDWAASSDAWGKDNEAGNAETLWNSLKPTGDATMGTLVYLAQEHPKVAKGESRLWIARAVFDSPEIKGLSHAAFRLYILLCYCRTGDDKEIRLSQKEVMARLGWGRTRTGERFKELYEAGLVKTVEIGRFSRGRCNTYRLTDPPSMPGNPDIE